MHSDSIAAYTPHVDPRCRLFQQQAVRAAEERAPVAWHEHPAWTVYALRHPDEPVRRAPALSTHEIQALIIGWHVIRLREGQTLRLSALRPRPGSIFYAHASTERGHDDFVRELAEDRFYEHVDEANRGRADDDREEAEDDGA